MCSEKSKKMEPAGTLYYKTSYFGLDQPEAQRYPAGSTAPIGNFLEKYDLDEEDMKASLRANTKIYPYGSKK